MTISQVLAHDEVSACVAIDEPAPNQIEHWAKLWVEYFRRDAAEVEDELTTLPDRLRKAAVALES